MAWRRGLALLCAAGTLALFPVAAPASARDAYPLPGKPAVTAEAGLDFRIAQYRPRLGVPRAGRIRPIDKRRRRLRKRPNAFRGLMTPSFGAQGNCLAPAQVRRRLKNQGWWDFRGLRRAGKDFVVLARRPNGTVYQLRLERCTGHVLKARPLSGEGGHRLWAR